MINTDLVTDVSTPSTIPGSDTQVGIEINPAVAELGSNLGSGDTVVSAPRPTVPTFQPSNSLEPMLEEAGFFVGAGAYLTEASLYRAMYDGLDEPEFQRDSTFDAAKTLQQDREAGTLNPDFQKELLGSVSNDDYKYRWGRIRDKQIAHTAMSEAPVGAFVGAVMDADLLLGLGVTKAVRTIGLTTRIGVPYSPSVIAGNRRSLAAGGAVLGGTVVGGTSYALGRTNEEVLWDAVGGAVGGLLDGFTAIPKASRTLPTVPNAAEQPEAAQDAISSYNPGFSQYMSSWDKLNGYSPGLASRLLANPMDDVAESAVAYGRSTILEADRALVPLEQAIKAEVPGWRSIFPQTRARARAETAELGRAARQWLNNAQQIEARGGVPVPPTDPRVKRIVDAYTEGNFGTIMGTRAQEAGVFGADALTPSKYYVPVRHSYLKMQEFIAQGKGSWTDLHKLYGQQIARIYPRLITPAENGGLGLSPEALGKKFVYTQKLRQADPKAQAFRGTTQDELAEVLRAEGVEEGKIKGLLSTLQPKADEAGKQKNLRTRMDWDYEGTYLGTKGQVMSINEFMDDDLLGSLQTYARNMSGRIGLARMGFTKESELDDAIGKALDNLPAAERQKAQEFFGNVKAQLLGQPVGEAAPDWFRTLTSYGASTQLGNSGMYAIADYAQLVNEFGVSTVAKHFLKSLSGVINAKSITKEQAETIQQVISGQLFAEGRVRPYVTHLEDNWVGPAGSIHEVAQYGGQYIKYLNGSEFMRRHQINAVAGIMDELVGNLAVVRKAEARAKYFRSLNMSDADVRKAEASAKYFRSLNMSDTDIAEATAQVQKHGTVIDNWDAAVKAKMMNTLISATDNIAITIRAGEQPAFIEHSAIGRVLFPYMRYVFGANQKILRRNYKRNGVMGVALYMSAAIPLSVVSGMMSNIIQGRDPEEDLVARTIRSLPGLGVASLAADGFMQGDVGGTAPVFAGPNNLFQMVDKLKRGELEVQDVLKTVPGANVFLPTRWLINSTKED